ncbi:MAG: hypothetical protein V4471_01500 [Pseudomonadota bacterium]
MKKKEIYLGLLNSLNRLNKLTEKKQTLSELIAQKTEIDELIQASPELISIVKDCLTNENGEDRDNSIQKNIIALFFTEQNASLKKKLTEAKTTQDIKKERTQLGLSIKNSAHPNNDEYAKHINLCVLEMLPNIVCLARYKRINDIIVDDPELVIGELEKKLSEERAANDTRKITFFDLVKVNAWPAVETKLRRLKPKPTSTTIANNSSEPPNNLASTSSQSPLIPTNNIPPAFKATAVLPPEDSTNQFPNTDTAQPNASSTFTGDAGSTNTFTNDPALKEMELTFKRLTDNKLLAVSTSSLLALLQEFPTLIPKSDLLKFLSENQRVYNLNVLDSQHQLTIPVANILKLLDNSTSPVINSLKIKELLQGAKSILPTLSILELLSKSKELGNKLSQINSTQILEITDQYIKGCQELETHYRDFFNALIKRSKKDIESYLKGEIDYTIVQNSWLSSLKKILKKIKSFDNEIARLTDEFKDKFINQFDPLVHTKEISAILEPMAAILESAKQLKKSYLDIIFTDLNTLITQSPNVENIIQPVCTLLNNEIREHLSRPYVTNTMAPNLTNKDTYPKNEAQSLIDQRAYELKINYLAEPKATYEEEITFLTNLSTQKQTVDNQELLKKALETINRLSDPGEEITLEEITLEDIQSIQELNLPDARGNIKEALTTLKFHLLTEKIKKTKEDPALLPKTPTVKLDEASNALELSKAEQTALRAELAQARETLAERERTLEDLSASKSIFDETLSSLQSEHEALKNAFEAYKSEKTVEIEKQTAEQKEKIENLARNIETLKAALDTEKSNNATNDMEINRLETEIKEKQEALLLEQAKSRRLEEDSEDSLRQISALKTQLTQVMDQIGDVQSAENTLQTELKKLKKEKAEIESKKIALESELESHEKLKKDQTKKIADLELQIKKLGTELEATDNNYSHATETINDLNKDITSKNSELTIERKKAADLEIKIADLQREIALFEVKQTANETELRSKLDKEIEKNHALNQELRELSQKCSSFIEKVNDELELNTVKPTNPQNQTNFHSLVTMPEDSDSEDDLGSEIDQNSYNKSLVLTQLENLQTKIISALTQLAKYKKPSALEMSGNIEDKAQIESPSQQSDPLFTFEGEDDDNDFEEDDYVPDQTTQPDIEKDYKILKKQFDTVTQAHDQELQEQQTAHQLALDDVKRKFDTEIEELTLAKENAEQQRDTNQSEIEKLQGKIHDLTQVHDLALQEQQTAHQRALDDVKRKFDTEIKELALAKENAEQQRDTNQSEIERLQGKIRDLTQAHEQTLQEQQTAHQRALDDVKRKFDTEIKELALAKENAEQQRDANKAEIDKLRKEMQSSDGQHTREKTELQKAFDAVQKKLTEKETAEEKSATKILQLQRQVAELTQQKDKLAEDLERYSDIEQKLRDAQLEKERLEDNINQLTLKSKTQDEQTAREIADYKRQLSQKDEEIKTLTQEKDAIAFNQQVYNNALEKIQSELDEKTDKLTSLTEANESLNSEIVQLRRENQKLKKLPGIEVSTQTDSAPTVSLNLSEKDGVNDDGQNYNRSDSSNESGDDDGFAPHSLSSKSSTDLTFPPSPVQSNNKATKGPLMPLAEKLLKNLAFQNALRKELATCAKEYCEDGVKNVIPTLEDNHPIFSLAIEKTQENFITLRDEVNKHFFPSSPEESPAGIELGELSILKIQREAISALQKIQKKLETTTHTSVDIEQTAKELISEIINNNKDDDDRELYPASHKLLMENLNQIKSRSQQIAVHHLAVSTILNQHKQELVEFSYQELKKIAYNAAKTSATETVNILLPAEQAALKAISKAFIDYLITLPDFPFKVSTATPNGMKEDAIISSAKQHIPNCFKSIGHGEGKNFESVKQQAENLGSAAAQRARSLENTTAPDSGNGSPSSSTPPTPPSGETRTKTSLSDNRVRNAWELSSNESEDTDDEATDTDEDTPLVKKNKPKRHPTSSHKATKSTSHTPSQQSPIGNSSSKTLSAEELRTQLYEYLKGKKEFSDISRPLQALQYASLQIDPHTGKQEEFSLALQAVCAISQEEANIFHSSNPFEVVSQFNDLRKKLRTDAFDPNTVNITEQDINTLEAKPWLNKKLQQITHRTIDIELTPEEKSRVTKLVQKEFPLSELSLPAITLKSPTELQEEVTKLKQFELKLINQSYQEFSKIESALPHYPSLIEERNDDATSESGDSGIEDESNFQRFHNTLNDKLPTDLTISEPQTNTLIDTISKRIETGFRKWRLFVDSKLISAIVADLNREEAFSDHPNKKELVSKAINVLVEEHQLGKTLKERDEWQKSIKIHYAAKEEIDALRMKVRDRIKYIEAMQLKKDAYNAEDVEKASESRTGKTSSNGGEIDKSTLGQPLPVYLPNDCRVINNDSELAQQTPNFTVTGELFQRRDTLEKNEAITYEQNLGDKKQQWSVTRTPNNALDYKTKWEHRWNPKSVTTKEVAFTQMIDAVQSFKSSKIINFNFSNCTKSTEKKYRIFIRAYRELGIGPTLRCPISNNLTMKTAEIDEAKAAIIKHLNLQNTEIETNVKNIESLSSSVETANIRIR